MLTPAGTRLHLMVNCYLSGEETSGIIHFQPGWNSIHYLSRSYNCLYPRSKLRGMVTSDHLLWIFLSSECLFFGSRILLGRWAKSDGCTLIMDHAINLALSATSLMPLFPPVLYFWQGHLPLLPSYPTKELSAKIGNWMAEAPELAQDLDYCLTWTVSCHFCTNGIRKQCSRDSYPCPTHSARK